MNIPTRQHWQSKPIPLSMLMLAILAFFTYAIFAYLPYTGFYFHPDTGEVLFFHTPNHSSLQLGDTLIKVGDVLFTEYKENPVQPLFTNEMKQDDSIAITVHSNGIEKNINWKMPGFNADEFRTRLFNIWWLAYIFWLFGACIEAFIRPREIRWWLLLSANHVTGLWLMLGSFSSWHLLGGSVLFHAVTWLVLPAYLHLNWIFPKPLRPLSKILVAMMYVISLLLFFGEVMQVLPKNLYALAFIITLIGSITLQMIHFAWQPQQRKQIRLLVIATALANLPLITLIVLSIFGETPPSSPVALLSLLLIPATYLYLIFRNQLGGVEVRANLFISILAFLILAGTILIILIQLTTSLPIESSALLTFIIPLLTAIFSIRFFLPFRKYVEKNFLGITLDYENLQENFSSRIITSTSIPSLLQLLESEVFPSLFIRQYAFVQAENHHLNPMLMKNITQAQLPEKEAMQELISKAGKYLPNLSSNNDDWLRLILPLKVSDSFIGFWLLGQRDPDDLYHQTEIPILQAIANQTAIALSNILYAEQLKQMYQLGIERYEQERLRLAHDLHDSVLNELADLRRNLGDNLSSSIQESYEEVTDRLREIVNDLRPPMLSYGLAPAIKALAEDLMQKTDNKVKIIVDLQTTEARIPENIELHLFRIVQEACKNSLRHAQATVVKISGLLSPQKVDFLIEDDGIGFDIGESWNLGNILANSHFGLAGIIERVHVIGAKLNIESKPSTKIQVLWFSERS